MKKVYISENQAKYIMEHLNEGDEMSVTYQKPANGTANISDMQNQLRNAKKAAPNADVSLSVSDNDLNLAESKKLVGSKKDLKEHRLNYLKKNSVKYNRKK